MDKNALKNKVFSVSRKLMVQLEQPNTEEFLESIEKKIDVIEKEISKPVPKEEIKPKKKVKKKK